MFQFLSIFVFGLIAFSWNEGFEMITVIILPHLKTQTHTPYLPTHMQTQKHLIIIIKKQTWTQLDQFLGVSEAA